MANDNKTLGRFQLTDIPPAPRGIPQVEVTFDIDANGIINVSAKDKGTGKEQNIKIESGNSLSEEEIKKMKADAEANAEADAEKKSEIEKLNQADAMIFQTEKQLKEFGEKLSDESKSEIEALKDELKKAHEAKDMDAIDSTLEKLNETWSKSSEQMYTQANEEQTADVTDENIQDVEAEEVS
tara:strand:- start:504 stop:1052 length:549 start_codon:yes stop_codon:yes gene_type:complete